MDSASPGGGVLLNSRRRQGSLGVGWCGKGTLASGGACIILKMVAISVNGNGWVAPPPSSLVHDSSKPNGEGADRPARRSSNTAQKLLAEPLASQRGLHSRA